jgi:hypothetical protein
MFVASETGLSGDKPRMAVHVVLPTLVEFVKVRRG